MEAAVIDRLAGWFDKFGATVNAETDGEALLIPPAATLARAEAYAKTPRFHRHHYSTERMTDFVAYATNAAKAVGAPNHATAYVLPDGSGARAVFDHGDHTNPEWGHHQATLKLKHSPAWVAAFAMSSGTRTQQQVIDWLEDWAPNITAHAQDGTDIEPRRAISALRRVKLEAKASSTHAENDFARHKTSMESIEASGETESLPAYFVLHSSLYVCTVSHEIVLRLGVREDSGKPVLALRIVGMERLIQDTGEWLESELTTGLGSLLAGVYVGTLEIGKV